MAKTVFVPNTQVTAAFLNAVNNPVHTAFPNNDGELPLIKDTDLDQSAGALLARSNDFLNAFATTTQGGLFATVGPGTVVLSEGTPVSKPATQLAIAANSLRFIWIDPFSAFKVGSANPNDGSVMLARVTTDATQVIAIADLRPRFQIGTVNYNAPAVVGQATYFEFPVVEREYIDEMGWIWLNPKGDVWISRTGSGGDVAKDSYERLFKRLWLNPSISAFNSSRVQVTKSATANDDWTTGRQLGIPGRMGRMPITPGVNEGVTYNEGDIGGLREVALSQAQMPVHGHPINDPGHNHTLYPSNLKSALVNGLQGGQIGAEVSGGGGGELVRNAPASTGITATQNSGNGQAHANMPPYFVSTRLIFTGVLA